MTGARRTVSHGHLLASQRVARVGSFELLLDRGEVDAESMVRWTEQAGRILDREPPEGEATLVAFLEPIHPDDRAAVRSALERIEKEPGGYQLEHRVCTRGGEERIVEQCAEVVRTDGGAPRKVVGTLRDVTEERRAAASARARLADLHANEASLRAILASTLDAIVTTDARGVIERVNPAVTRMFGWSPEELVGRELAMLAPAAAPLTPGSGRGVTGVRKNGTSFPAELAVAEYVAEGEARFAAVFHDITERRKLELNVAEDELRVRTSIAYDLHDVVGQLVAAARMLTQSIVRDAPPRLRDRVGRVSNLLGDALEHIRSASRSLSTIEIVETSIGDALASLAEQTRTIFGMGCTLQIDPDLPEPGSLQKNQAYLIAREAVLNASKHSGGTHVKIAFALQTGWFRLSVSDDGKGIPEGANLRGVGLSSMEYRARLLGGNLALVTPREGGTEVVVTWPRED